MWALLVILFHILAAMVPLLIVFRHRIIFIAVCIVLLLLFSIFIIYDTQVIAGGEKYGLGFDDYIVGALLLYTVRLLFGGISQSIGHHHNVYLDTYDSCFN